jgi:hypothetical protein
VTSSFNSSTNLKPSLHASTPPCNLLSIAQVRLRFRRLPSSPCQPLCHAIGAPHCLPLHISFLSSSFQPEFKPQAPPCHTTSEFCLPIVCPDSARSPWYLIRWLLSAFSFKDPACGFSGRLDSSRLLQQCNTVSPHLHSFPCPFFASLIPLSFDFFLSPFLFSFLT